MLSMLMERVAAVVVVEEADLQDAVPQSAKTIETGRHLGRFDHHIGS